MRLTEGSSLQGQSVDVHPDMGGWWMTGTERKAEAARGACGIFPQGWSHFLRETGPEVLHLSEKVGEMMKVLKREEKMGGKTDQGNRSFHCEM